MSMPRAKKISGTGLAAIGLLAAGFVSTGCSHCGSSWRGGHHRGNYDNSGMESPWVHNVDERTAAPVITTLSSENLGRDVILPTLLIK